MNRYSVVDLHCHTNHSDGLLGPLDLLARAEEQGVELLAITDHDEVSGLLEAMSASANSSVKLVSGIELSSVWNGVGVHVVGLNFDLESPQLAEVLEAQRQARDSRSIKIAERLQRLCEADVLQGARAIALNRRGLDPSSDHPVQLGRPHFADFLVESGIVDSREMAFRKYLGAGKPGDVKSHWPELETVVGWITSMGGTAVLAHPHHYKMTNTRLRKLLGSFKASGGEAMEVVTGGLPRQKIDWFASLCEAFDLRASVGSDFHAPVGPWCELGNLQTLPGGCDPVWASW
ncbi:PHP domain-containing protein [Aestuariirhabdus sp. Z084]|uniref:PHP domain-containing protein n=1 Tax=Aestuariirhabdus haliotis TaxID=2918751 RepID=UPI00201B36AD|nr:PHP domain-containing protein [Aestuariirhabdus haliotis]MCL6417320.1 PHP domain-containing protein [Aestuariirhabdus haliotis]MCL6421265.1 PHP domain-containing protein [Aestuariirhabdus haliotis]